jgi:hypothetical protein
VADLLHDFTPGVIRGADPEGPDGRIGGHLGDRRERLGLADSERLDQGAGFAGPFWIWVENAQDVGIPDADETLDVKAGDESAADDPDPEDFLVMMGHEGLSSRPPARPIFFL